MSKLILKVEDLHAYYGKSHVLHGVSFEVNQGEIVALLGRNGTGKTTLARLITTEKDYVRLPDFSKKSLIDVLPIEIVFDDPDAIVTFLQTRIADQAPS